MNSYYFLCEVKLFSEKSTPRLYIRHLFIFSVISMDLGAKYYIW